MVIVRTQEPPSQMLTMITIACTCELIRGASKLTECCSQKKPQLLTSALLISRKNGKIQKEISYTDESTCINSRVRKDECFSNPIPLHPTPRKRKLHLEDRAWRKQEDSAESVKVIHVKGCFTHKNINYLQSRNAHCHHWNKVQLFHSTEEKLKFRKN